MAETYETLKARMGDWLGVDTVRLPDTVRGDCLNIVQRRLLRKHDLRFGEITDTLSITANDRDYTLPTGYRSTIVIWYTNPSSGSIITLNRKTKEAFDALYPDPSETGAVADYTVWGDLFYVGPTPEIGLTLNRNYYYVLPDLADGAPNNTNAFVVNAWDVLFFGALEEVTKYLIEDSRAPMWAERFRELESDLVGEHQREKSVGRIPQSEVPG